MLSLSFSHYFPKRSHVYTFIKDKYIVRIYNFFLISLQFSQGSIIFMQINCDFEMDLSENQQSLQIIKEKEENQLDFDKDILQQINFKLRKQEQNVQIKYKINRKWTYEQNILYVRFLKLNSRRFGINDGDKKFRKYKKMSLYLVSKTPKQCRTHHQKMMLKYERVNTIIEELSFERQQAKKFQKEYSKETLDNQHEMISYSKANTQGDCANCESQRPDKSFKSYSSELIFDILF